MNPDLIVSWPTGSFSLMAAEPAVNVIYEREIRAAAEPAAARQHYLALFEQTFAPDDAAKEFGLDDIIDPRDTRKVLIRSLDIALDRSLPVLGFKHAVSP